MRYFIPIDPTTIKRNSNAGATQTHYPGMSRASSALVFGHCDRDIGQDILRGIESLVLFADGLVVRVAYQEEGPIIWHEVDAVLSPEGGKLLERLAHSVRALVEAAGGRLDPERTSIVFAQEMQTARHGPIHTFAYGHVPTEVACDACGVRFPHTDLEHDDCDGGDDNYAHTEAKCPRYGEWDCCELSFEYVRADGTPCGDTTWDDGRFERGSC